MRRRGLPQTVLLLACASVVPVLLAACKKPEPAVVDAGAEPAPIVIDAAPAVLAPLDEDAGTDAGDAAPVHHATGPGLNTNQARVKQCCNAMRAQGGTDPIIKAMAANCDTLVTQLGANGNAPEFAQFKMLLKTAKVPAICQGL